MLKTSQYHDDLFSKRYFECMLPSSHILLDIMKLVDFSFINAEVRDLYSDVGRGSVDPERMFKMLFLMFFCNIPSERELTEQVQVNVLYRHFTGINLDETIPDHSSFTVFRQRLGKDRFKRLFDRIITQCINHTLIDGSHLSFDATIIKANAAVPNKRAKDKILADADKLIEKSFDNSYVEEDKNDKKELPLASSDPDARWTKRKGKPAMPGYGAHISTDSKEKVITDIEVTPADTRAFEPMISMIEKQREKHKIAVNEVSADSEYSTGHLRQALEKHSIDAYIPIRETGHKNRPGMFGYEDFRYDKERDIVICPAGGIMRFIQEKLSANDTVSARVYRSSKKDCSQCLSRDRCTSAKCGMRTIEISIYYDVMQRARARNMTPRYAEALRLRKILTEPKFAEGKRYHGLNQCRYRGLEQVNIQCILTAICINVKRLVNVLLSRLESPTFNEALAYR